MKKDVLSMKVCTYNVNSIRARTELLLKWLEKRDNDLDVLCLQELRCSEESFPFDKLEALGYNIVTYSQPQYNGVAVCSKTEPKAVRMGLNDSFFDEQKRVISCKINDITFINVYAPHGAMRGEEKYHYKLEWFSAFKKYLESYHSPDDPLIAVGDFNVTLEDKDVYDPELLEDSIGTMPEEREMLQDFLDWGLVDTFRYLYPEKTAYTWWSYIGGGIWKDEGMRIDYIFCSNPMLKDLVEGEIDLWPRRRRKPTPSDHAPVIARFK